MDDNHQVARDQAVLNQLKTHGDDPEISRPFDHTSYFKSGEAARAFETWLNSSGYENVEVASHKAGLFSSRVWYVQCQHIGKAHLADVTQHSLALSAKAQELGGDYDGWGCPVMHPE